MKVSFSSKNTEDSHKKINRYLRAANQWFLQTPSRALEEAYKAALIIKAMEDEHFSGNKIAIDSGDYGDGAMSYLQGDLEKNLKLTKLRLAEFKLSRYFLNASSPELLEKLKFIDNVIDKYSYKTKNSLALVPISETVKIDPTKEVIQSNSPPTSEDMKVDSISQKTGVLPRSIGRTIKRIKTDLDPKAEAEVIKNFRSSRNRTRIAIRFIIVLIVLPLLVQQLSKPLIINRLIDHFQGENESPIFLNSEMKEEALRELQSFEEGLKFEGLISQSPQLSQEEIEEKVKHKATEIAEEFRGKSRHAIANVFADLLALIAFALVVVTSQREIIVLKSFMDDIVYGLSDSAKAFIIILLTDIFVGFHSPHGWEVLLEGLAGHLGIAANKSMIMLFIATVPVILDTIFKYWIFRYLSRISPSAVATLRNMNE